MPRRANQVQKLAEGAAGVAMVNAVETVICTLAGVSTDTPGARVILEGAAQITVGTSGTAVTLRIRRGTEVTSPLVGAAVVQTAVATNQQTVACQAVDNPEGELASQSYVLTAQTTAGTANSTAVESSLSATY